MLYREIMAVCSEIHTKHINTVCGQNVELLKYYYYHHHHHHVLQSLMVTSAKFAELLQSSVSCATSVNHLSACP